MAKYLVSTTEVYRADDEYSATQLIEDAKADSRWALTKYNCEHKEKKSKGDIVDEWYKVTLVKVFNDEKDPTTDVKVSYEVDYGTSSF